MGEYISKNLLQELKCLFPGTGNGNRRVEDCWVAEAFFRPHTSIKEKINSWSTDLSY